MEAEIERLHQLIEELNNKVEGLQTYNMHTNTLIEELEERFESFRLSMLSSMNV